MRSSFRMKTSIPQKMNQMILKTKSAQSRAILQQAKKTSPKTSKPRKRPQARKIKTWTKPLNNPTLNFHSAAKILVQTMIRSTRTLIRVTCMTQKTTMIITQGCSLSLGTRSCQSLLIKVKIKFNFQMLINLQRRRAKILMRRNLRLINNFLRMRNLIHKRKAQTKMIRFLKSKRSNLISQSIYSAIKI